ncbi:nucleotidyltransferase [Alkalicoccobacillus murimartini]|uniref:tRNA(Met) cytidine acetate ligase n=1 Tax=Alkalicoccobacillus murimartini TaxID=171685 RepID=A0ABT9YG04_9BACI|nr:nucleotidyltransferase [Alkalicoccobacillus murimartini]MDQ0206461.1 putative nucleotidyltransferase [Alkalicoccobacillus murimartini]
MPPIGAKQRAVGLVVEYNPFHNGHLYHLNQAKHETGADIVVAVMSSSFLQRGEPALLSKWARTKMALANGVDLVLELPYAFATQKAELFASGAVAILSEAKVDCLHFGSESGSIKDFHHLLSFMRENREPWDELVKSHMQQGQSYPKACALAFKSLDANTALSLDQPNNILGYHYVKAIADQGSAIVPYTTKRLSADYHDTTLPSSSIASATSIRQSLANEPDGSHLIKHVMPESALQELMTYQTDFNQLHTWELYYPFLQYRVLSSSTSELASIYECEEGLEFRIQETISRSSTFIEWMTAMKTKRYTWTRLQRLSTHLLTNTTKVEMNSLHQSSLPYIRPLGMTEAGQQYLKYLKKHSSVTILSRFAATDHPLAKTELKASRSYIAPLPTSQRMAQIDKDFSTIPIRM